MPTSNFPEQAPSQRSAQRRGPTNKLGGKCDHPLPGGHILEVIICLHMILRRPWLAEAALSTRGWVYRTTPQTAPDDHPDFWVR